MRAVAVETELSFHVGTGHKMINIYTKHTFDRDSVNLNHTKGYSFILST